MINSIEAVKVKQCGDGKIKKEYLLPRAMTRDMVAGMNPAGEVYIMDYLADPVYTIIHGSLFNLRGVVGKRKIEVWYTAEEMNHLEPFLLNIFVSVIASQAL